MPRYVSFLFALTDKSTKKKKKVLIRNYVIRTYLPQSTSQTTIHMNIFCHYLQTALFVNKTLFINEIFLIK